MMKRNQAAAKAAVVAAVMMFANVAHAAGLAKGRSVLATVQTEMQLYIPLVATLALGILAILWATKVMHFRSVAQWAGGVILAGSASEIVSMLF
jgi:hypothetical protein